MSYLTIVRQLDSAPLTSPIDDILTEEAFIDLFKPVKNPLNPTANYDGCLFETVGTELDLVITCCKTHHLHIWTVVECDGRWEIANGYHLVNRIGYLITTHPFPGEGHITIIDPDDDEEDF